MLTNRLAKGTGLKKQVFTTEFTENTEFVGRNKLRAVAAGVGTTEPQSPVAERVLATDEHGLKKPA